MQNAHIAVLAVLTVISMAATDVHAQTPPEILNQYIADLQNNPGDTALREKIILYAQCMRPAAAIPDEARRHMNRGIAAAEGASAESDYLDAIAEFQKAVDIAPWLGSGYRNLAVMQDKAGQYAQALQNLKLFLLTNPAAADAEAAKSLMDKIEYRQEKALRTKTTATPEKMEEPKKGIGDLVGNWYRKEPYDHQVSPYDDHYHYRAEMRNGLLYLIEVTDRAYWGGQKGSEKEWFIASGLDGDHLTGRPAVAADGVIEITTSPDCNTWTFTFHNQYQTTIKSFIRK